MTFAHRITRVKPSPTLATAAKAAALKAQGQSVINFSVGEPDFDTPEHIKEACIKALRDGATKYGPVPGLLTLREAIGTKLQRDNGLSYSPEEIIVTCGAKEALFAALQVLVNPGDEVIIPAPYWVSYSDQVVMCDGVPRILAIPAARGFKLTPEVLRAACTSKTNVVMLNSPCNPTGIVYSREELVGLAHVCAEKNLWVISDEIYEDLVYRPATFCSFGTAAPELRERTVIINGLSKSFAMTGWRVGWAVGPKALIHQMNTWQGQVTSHATAFAQHGALAAYTGPLEPLRRMQHAFGERRETIISALAKIPHVQLVEPDGAFYAFPDVAAYLGRSAHGATIKDTTALADFLLEEARIATVAGEGFGAPGFLRFSYALGLDDLTEGLTRFAHGLQSLGV